MQNVRLVSREADQFEGCRSIRANQLINFLNRINFQEGYIKVNFQHPKYTQTVSLKAKPQLCVSNDLHCIWQENTGYNKELSSYSFVNFSLTDGLNQILVEAEVIKIDENGIVFNLPEKGYEISQRQYKRSSSDGVIVELMQNGIAYHGKLIEFSSASFNIEVSCEELQTFKWINKDYDVYVILKKDEMLIYSGTCKIIRQTGTHTTRNLMVKPIIKEMHRFRSKKFRSIRHYLSPPPDIVFQHPLSGKTINLNIADISITGFSVEENLHKSELFPGMIIPNLGIEIMGSHVLQCKAQVMYQNILEDSIIRSGLAILDMNTQDHVALSSVLYKAEDNNSHFSTTNIDMEALWAFFFETGFVYPKKYAFIQAEKEKFTNLYNKLYTKSPDIARHIIYQDKGAIQGHISMLRCYEQAWIIHHHAAITSSRSKAGFTVLHQIAHYANEYNPLCSSSLNYIIAYFRPQNRFPNKAFGDMARRLENPKGASLDSFTYYYFQASEEAPSVSKCFTFEKSSEADLGELRNFYEHTSGGLMIEAMDLAPKVSRNESDINKEYRRLEFKRHHTVYSLKVDDTLKALFIVLSSDIGLNMSDLTNCIHIVVLDQTNIEQTDLEYCQNVLNQKYYNQEEVPVLLAPVKVAESLGIEYEKIYDLWILKVEYLDFYFDHVDNLLNPRKRRAKAVAKGS